MHEPYTGSRNSKKLCKIYFLYLIKKMSGSTNIDIMPLAEALQTIDQYRPFFENAQELKDIYIVIGTICFFIITIIFLFSVL
jgi:hypothetical protein